MVRYMPKQEKGAFRVPTERLTSMVERVKQGDELAKSEIYATFEGYLARYFAKKIPAQDIPDRVQNTFTHVYRNINTVKKPAAFASWMRTIARREIYHYYKKIERAQTKEEKTQKRTEKEKLRKEKRMAGIDLTKLDMREAVNTLPDKQKEAVLLREKGYKVKEIAEIQNVTEGTVKSRLNYARRKVNAYIEAQTPDNRNHEASSR